MKRYSLLLLLILVANIAAAETVTIKFAEGSGVRLRNGRFSSDDIDIAAVNDVLASRHASVTRLFHRPVDVLDRERSQSDLNLFYTVAFPDDASAEDALKTLATLRVVEYAETTARPAPPPSFDIAPTTPSLVYRQSYRAAAPLGLGFNDVQSVADGNDVRIADVEMGWTTDHEDLDLQSPVIGYSNADYADHGAAVTGLLHATDNAYGISGVAPRSNLVLVSGYSDAKTYSLANAINVAASNLRSGDVMLVEQQLYCFTNVCPAEWDRATSAAIRNAVARGIVVVEAAGNGGFNLDETRFTERLGSDSGAIMVGAGSSSTWHETLVFSNYGARVDVQGFGENVATLGYGDAFNPSSDPRQRYTMEFAGTSSATAIVAGAAAVVQSARKNRGLDPLTSTAMRNALIATGTPQQRGGHIGPLPNVAAAIAAIPQAVLVPSHRRSSSH